MSFAAAEHIANAVLDEGNLLYPCRANAEKNRVRWQFDDVAPREFADATGSDPWFAQTECLIETIGDTRIDLRVGFLRVCPSAGTVAGEVDEGVERSIDVTALRVADLCEREHCEPVVLEDRAIHGSVRIRALGVGPLFRLRVRVENTTPDSAGLQRDNALRLAFVGTHALMVVHEGRFLSLLDPPADAADAVAECTNLHT